jgi:hypothetical protein
VLLVTDVSFDSLYGPSRAHLGALEGALRLGRRLIPVLIAETAGPDLAAMTVGAVVSSPYAVLFPYRYYDGALRYKEEFPEVPVLVLGGRTGEIAPETGLVPVFTDRDTDFYRAGLCAALLAREEKNGNVLVYGDGTLSGGERQAFLEGLRAQGFIKTPIYLGLNSEYTDFAGVSCAVLAGPASRFLAENRKIPVLLFSWVDPAITPFEVKVIFDDSPWVLAVGAVKTVEEERGDASFPSRPTVLRGRYGKELSEKLESLVREERP